MLVTPLSSDLQRIPPSSSRHAFRRACPSCRLSTGTAISKDNVSRLPRLQGFMHLEGPCITNEVLPKLAVRAPHGLRPSEGFPPRVSASCFHKASSHGLGLTLPTVTPEGTAARPESRMSTTKTKIKKRKTKNKKRTQKWTILSNSLYRVSKSPRIGLPLSRTAALLEVFARPKPE
jgi:hypothetical protein